MNDPKTDYKIFLIECESIEFEPVFQLLKNQFLIEKIQKAEDIFIRKDLPDAVLCNSSLKSCSLIEFLEMYSKTDKINTLPLFFIHADQNCKEKSVFMQYGVLDCFSLNSQIEEIVPKIKNLLKLLTRRLDLKLNEVKSTIKNSIEKINYLIKEDISEKQLPMKNFYESFHLTEREIQILELIIENRSNKEISRSLDISVHTVSNHIKNIFGKLKINKRIDLIKLAIKNQQK